MIKQPQKVTIYNVNCRKEERKMKVRIPQHREFVINIEEVEESLQNECWEKLQQVLNDYVKTGKSVYTPTFIEDNEDKVKALQEEYKFSYTVEWKK